MGLLKKLNKSVKKMPKVMMVAATFENWQENPETQPAVFLQNLIDEVKEKHPLYRYLKSTFEYTFDGNIDFKLKFVLKEFRGALSISR